MRERNTKTITFDNAIVTIHFPNLTEDKRRLRTKAMHKAAEDLYDIYDEALDEVRDGLREFPETEVEIYIYKNKLACINMVMDDMDTEVELLFKGGDFRAQNMELTLDDGYSEYSMELEGKSDGSKEKYEVSVEGEELLVFEYNRKNGNFSIESEDFEFEGKLLSERNAVTVSFDVEDVEVNVSISKGTNF